MKPSEFGVVKKYKRIQSYVCRGWGTLPETIYQAGINAFGVQDHGRIIYLVGRFHLVGIILNGYDVSVSGNEDTR